MASSSSKAGVWAGQRASEQFPDPFCDISSLAMPENIRDALRWCEFVLTKNGPYREALNRVIAYFNTDIEIVAPPDKQVGREERQKYLDFLNDTLGIKDIIRDAALDYLGYGNSLTSLIVPFRRYLSCHKCSLELPLKRVYQDSRFGFSWSDFQFVAQCPHCGYRGPWRHIDRRGGEKGELKVKRWSPHEIDILDDPYTRDKAYVWKIPDDYRNLIRKGHLWHLERAPWEVIQAIKNNQALMFDQDVIYHMKEESLAGLNDRGWGYSRVLTNFTHAWYVQVLHRYNEAIALDYVIPFRVITPAPRQGQAGDSNDPVLTINLGGFRARVEEMLRARRQDPARWNVLPYPIEYQSLGGDATALAPKELIELGMDTLLNATGVPVQLYKGDLSVQSAPAALRLFEANWAHLVHRLNRFVNKICEKISQLMSWEPVICRMVRVTHADDLNRQMAKLQLMMGGQISRTTGLGSVGIDFVEEERRKIEEERISSEATANQQEEMAQSAQMDEMAMPQDPNAAAAAGGAAGAPPQGAPGAAPAGGAPATPGAAPGQIGPLGQPMGPGGAMQNFLAAIGFQKGQPYTVEEMQSIAMTAAQQLMTMPDSQRQSTLIQIKKEDPTMHSLVKSLLDDMMEDAALKGRDLVLQQQYGKVARAIDLG